MTHELVFPLSTMAVVFFAIIPLATVCCNGALAWRRRRATAWADVGSPTTFLLLLAPTVVPLAWLVSAAVHQVESYPSLAACLYDHVGAQSCLDAPLLLASLAGVIVLASLERARRSGPGLDAPPLPQEHPLVQRVWSLRARHGALRDLRVQVTSECAIPVFTTGWFRPRVVMDACFVHASDDAMLLAALLHERAHLRHRDNLRRFVAACSLSLNPLGGLLLREYAHWRQALEARCDQEAVAHGARPLALAQSIVQAAKFECGESSSCRAVGLACQDMSALRLRLALLMEGGEGPRADGGYVAFGLLLAWATLGPHLLRRPGVLEAWHQGVERLFLSM